jgi:hypothetical protein
MSGKTRPTIAAVIGAVAIAALTAGGSAQPAAAAGCGANTITVKFKNELSYPVWLGEQGPSEIAPTVNGNIDWKIKAGKSVDLCLPNEAAGGYASSQFWARTGCQFDTYYPTSCATTSDCATGFDCFADRCVPDCSQQKSDSYCQSQFTGNPSTATCYQNKYCVVEGICATGDCNGQYSCTTDGTKVGASGPTSVFEPTVDSGDNLTYYDVSLASGYNVPIKVQLSVTPSGTCQESQCNSDLLSSCNSALQITTAPTATVGPIPCGAGLYCQAGACVNNTCVLGCNDPGDQCTRIDPQCTTPLKDGTLKCCSQVPSGTGWTKDGADYVDMYLAKNYSGATDPTNKGSADPMLSSNSGNPVCWGAQDCAPGQTCQMGVITATGWPAEVGICIGPNPTQWCNGMAVGAACGADLAYDTGAFGYTCVDTTSADLPLACVPPFGSNAIIGLGTLTQGNVSGTYYSGEAGLLNPEWQAAALQAGGGTTPFYKTVAQACPNQYTIQYDDNSGSFTCTQDVNYTVIFGGIAGGPTATPTQTATPTTTASATQTPTATATSSATASPTASATATVTATATATTATSSPTATASSSVTPTATSTATATASPTASASVTATSTSTSSASVTPTATATVTATATSTATSTATPTMTPTPSGTATPRCAPSFLYLTTNPDGTLAFGDAAAGHPITLPLTLTSSAPVGLFNLSTKITGSDAKDFSVAGGNCTTINKLSPNATCTYNVTLKAKKKFLNAVNANLEITAMFRPGVCPAGDVQNVGVLLAGFVAQAGTRTPGSP